ncbi:hypothetical protein J2797_005577 [Paraburkholderia terricola]|uniref:hypothetical protein n=1 Tax=Paraburkholderia terricola TaxID=169427 RepID=UPI00285C9462|nr:hypothetical protein [Paraburkholderia terricola]MDR6495653.1 hypothetical protein [Paraburkholderia terricola]
MNLEEFFESVEARNIAVPVTRDKHLRPYHLSNEALFHIPLIAMVLLVLAKDRRKPAVAELGQLVGECLSATIAGFKGDALDLGWSANLRVRTVKALAFLEIAGLVRVDNRKSKLQITELGEKVVSTAARGDDHLAIKLAQVQRTYRNLAVERQLNLRLV